MTERADVVVVGAGPAGAAAALAARRAGPTARVVLLDRATFPRDKACGDGIAAHALDELAALGVADTFTSFPAVDVLRLVGPDGTTVDGRCGRTNRVVPRAQFDAVLVDAAVAAGAELRHHRVRSVEQRDGEVVVDGVLRAPVVVGADGAASTVRRALGLSSNPQAHTGVALRAYAPASPRSLDEQVIELDAGAWPAYAWAFPVGGGRANIGYGVRQDRLADHDGGGRALLRERLGTLLPDSPPEPGSERAAKLPFSTWRPTPAVGRVLLAGDAASLVNPLTGEGIFYAVLSGRLAGTLAVRRPDAAGRLYRRALRRRLGRHLRQTSLLARLAAHRPLIDAAVRVVARHPRAFEEYAEVGLGDGTLSARTFTRVLLEAATARRRS